MKRDYLTLGIACLSLAITVYALVTLQAVRSDHQQNLERFEKLEEDIRASIRPVSLIGKGGDSNAALSNSIPASERVKSKRNLALGFGEFAESDDLDNEGSRQQEVDGLVDTIVSRVQERLDNQVENLERENKRDRYSQI